MRKLFLLTIALCCVMVGLNTGCTGYTVVGCCLADSLEECLVYVRIRINGLNKCFKV